MKPGSIILDRRLKGNPCMAPSQSARKKTSKIFRQRARAWLLSCGLWSSDPCRCGAERGDDSSAYIKMLIELRKRWNELGLHEFTRNLAAACQCKARLHTSSKTGAAITKFGWTLLPHPPYDSDLPPSEIHVWGGGLKDAVRCATVECWPNSVLFWMNQMWNVFVSNCTGVSQQTRIVTARN